MTGVRLVRKGREKYPHLFEPLPIGNIKVANRLFVPPMVTNYATSDGFVTERIISYYESRAKGGYGLVIVGSACIDYPEGRSEAFQLSLDDDAYVPGMARLAESMKKHGAKAVLQLVHCGAETTRRLAGVQPVGPSAVKAFSGEVARELAVEEIQRLTERFAVAALRAKRAGFDAVEIHGATWYLVAQFLSRHWNKRQDRYGGTLENRARFMVEVIQAIRKAVGSDFTVWIRLNGTEFGLEQGVTLEEAKQFAQIAQESGVNAIHISSFGAGRHADKGTPLERNALIPIAAEIKEVVAVPVMTVGRIDIDSAETFLAQGKVDMIGTGRASIADPELPNKLSAGLRDEIRPCIGCLQCLNQVVTLQCPLKCTVNPRVGREEEAEIGKPTRRKTVAVIGGGPGGMEAAIVMAEQGHEVTLYEKQNVLGGQLLAAAVPPGKGDISKLKDYLQNQAQKSGVKVITNKEITVEDAARLKVDTLVIATGGIPLVPKIKGLESVELVTAPAVLLGEAEVGQRVVIIGGGQVGCETAEYLANLGKEVLVTEILDSLANGMNPIIRSMLLRRLKDKGVRLFSGIKQLEIKGNRMLFKNREDVPYEIIADTFVLACGAGATGEFWSRLKGMFTELYFVGDSLKPRGIMEAIEEGECVGGSIQHPQCAKIRLT